MHTPRWGSPKRPGAIRLERRSKAARRKPARMHKPSISRTSMDGARSPRARHPPREARPPRTRSNPTGVLPPMFRGPIAHVTRDRRMRVRRAILGRGAPEVCGVGWGSCVKCCTSGAGLPSAVTCVIGSGTVQLRLPRRPPGTPEGPLRRAACSHVRARRSVFGGRVRRGGGELSAGTSAGPRRNLCSCSSG